MIKSFLLLFLTLLLKVSFAQTPSFIQGKVIDAKTKEPLPFVTIYLARTSIGSSSLEDGTFKLDNIPVGKYDLTVSMVGYGRFTKSIEFTGNGIENFIVQLNQISLELKTVTITGHREKSAPSAYAKFEQLFLGQTSNALHCKILNKDDIYAANTKEGKLIAYASKPIVVLNKALGYTVTYDLKEFETDFKNNRLTILGAIRFEELPPANGKQKSKWMKERDRTYYGSDVHFLRSLISRKLSDNFYTIKRADDKPLTEDDLIKNDKIQFKGQLNVIFAKENGQKSQIIFNGNPIKVYENGYLEDFHNVVFLGQFQMGGVADIVPLGYVPSKSLKETLKSR